MKRHYFTIVLLLATLPSMAFAQRVEHSATAPTADADPARPIASDAQPAGGSLQSGRLYAQAAPSPYYGQPMYAQPGYAPPPPQPHRMVVPYVGGRLPPGATIERQRRMGLLIPGAILFGLSYGGMIVHGLTCGTSASTAGGCLTTNTGWLYVPIVGPFVAISGSSNQVDSITLGILGVLETVGFAGLVAGILFPRRVVVYQGYGQNESTSRRTASQWSLLPAAPGAFAGLTLSVTHY